MKLQFLIITLFICTFGFSQNKGTISGSLTDKDASHQALAFANVLIKGTKIATNTDIDGKYAMTVNPGNYILQFSFLGYESVEVPVTVAANQTLTVNRALGSGSFNLEDVVIKKASTNREKETALLLDQKQAVVIKQSIGAQEMARKGVSDVEEGLTKITGITKVDGQRFVYQRTGRSIQQFIDKRLAITIKQSFQKNNSVGFIPDRCGRCFEYLQNF